MPTLALANGLWIGEIPDKLQDLTYAEQLLIARVHHNRCIVKVTSGMSKMHTNAISFSNPMAKIYNVLPPPAEEMDDVLAFIYTWWNGPLLCMACMSQPWFLFKF